VERKEEHWGAVSVLIVSIVLIYSSKKAPQIESHDRMSFRCDENAEVWERVGFE